MEDSRNQEEDLCSHRRLPPPLPSPNHLGLDPPCPRTVQVTVQLFRSQFTSRGKALPKMMRIFVWVFSINYRDICMHFYGNSLFGSLN